MTSPALPAAYTLRYLGDPALRVVCTPLNGAPLPDGLLDAMHEALRPGSPLRTLEDNRSGAGLAANQVGGTVRVILVTIGREIVTMLDPVILDRSLETAHRQEGCLSIPGFEVSKPRPEWLHVRYRDVAGASHECMLTGFEAQCVAHEVDHLDGVLIVDGLPRQQRRRAERIIFDLATRAAA